ncbi:MAG: sigma-70 family RNA polymerase sigma factor [Erysipelotrichaceae bacterium]|nr:sigma-70 family RNA polymerase sigma factor [Erysipelotrichaceae bacterium]
MTREERENINLNLLVDMTRAKSDRAFETLSDYYYPVMVALYQELTQGRSFISRDEAMQAGKIGLYNAVCGYRDDRNMSFNNFAKLCIRREMAAWQRKEMNYCYACERRVVSLDHMVKDADDICYMDTVDSNEPDSEAKNNYRELESDIFRKVPAQSLDGQILKYRIEGYTYKEIADFMTVNPKYIDNSLRKSRKKIISLFD